MNQPEIVSILIPCLNEEHFIEGCLTSVLSFECPAHVTLEVLVLDGMSADRTTEIARRIASGDARVRVISNPGRIQSTAVNIGVREAQGAWIMRLDAHAYYPKDYLALCYSTAIRSGAHNVGGLFITKTSTDTYPARIVQALTSHKFGVGDAGYRTGGAEADVDTVPYGFFRRSIFSEIGMFDERLIRAQDYEFNRRIIATGGRVRRNPEIKVFYFNQPTLVRFFKKQFFREAPFNAYLWYCAPYAFAWRHAITAVFAAGCVGGLATPFLSPWLWTGYLGTLALYFSLALLASIQQAIRFKEPRHILALPAFFFLYHFMHGIGVWLGLIRLVCGKAPVQAKPGPWPGAKWRRIPVKEFNLSTPTPTHISQ